MLELWEGARALRTPAEGRGCSQRLQLQEAWLGQNQLAFACRKGIQSTMIP